MRLGSVDTFLLDDPFWQSKMGKPVANREFLRALLQYGSFQSIRFFCDDVYGVNRFRETLEQLAGSDCLRRVEIGLKSRFREQCAENPIDVMHHGDFTFFMPHVIEERNHCGQSFRVSGVTHSLDGQWLQTRLLQLLLAGPKPSDAIVCTSRCAMEYLNKAFAGVREAVARSIGGRLSDPPELVHIPLGLPERAFLGQERAFCRSRLNLDPDHFVILSLARFSPRHKMDLSPVLEALQWACQQRSLPNFTLILAGAARPSDAGLVRAMIERLGLSGQVKLELNIDEQRKALLYDAADVFLSMVDNYQETFGLSVLEAMAHGLPVVASDFNGYKELVAHERTGFLVPTHAGLSDPFGPLETGFQRPSVTGFFQAQQVFFDFEGMLRALAALAFHRNLRESMGLRARWRALRYRWENLIPRYEELWLHQQEEREREDNSRAQDLPRLPILCPDTRELFSHYPSGRIRRQDRVALSSYGTARVADGFEPICYEDLRTFLGPRCIEALVHHLNDRDWRIDDLLTELKHHFGLSESAAFLHLNWLSKHGYVDFPSAEPLSSSGKKIPSDEKS